MSGLVSVCVCVPLCVLVRVRECGREGGVGGIEGEKGREIVWVYVCKVGSCMNERVKEDTIVFQDMRDRDRETERQRQRCRETETEIQRDRDRDTERQRHRD